MLEKRNIIATFGLIDYTPYAGRTLNAMYHAKTTIADEKARRSNLVGSIFFPKNPILCVLCESSQGADWPVFWLAGGGFGHRLLTIRQALAASKCSSKRRGCWKLASRHSCCLLQRRITVEREKESVTACSLCNRKSVHVALLQDARQRPCLSQRHDQAVLSKNHDSF